MRHFGLISPHSVSKTLSRFSILNLFGADTLSMVRSGHVVMLCALLLLTIGVVMVQSAGMQVRPLETGADPTAAAAVSGVSAKSLLTSKTSLYLVLAVGAMAFASRLPIRRFADRLERVVWFKPGGDHGMLLLGTLMLVGLLALVYVPGIARVKNGSGRWINLHVPGLESVQPSEIVKWAIIILVAWYAARLGSYKENKLRRFFSGLVPVCLAVGFIAGVIVLEDLGTGALMVLVAGIVLLAAGARWIHFGMFIPPALAGVVLAILAAPYRVQRITAFLDPYADAKDSGYHMIQSMATVAGGGIFGRGLGNGLQKFGYLPEDTTDFLFAIVSEELGLVGVLIVVLAYAGIVWSGTSIAMRERSAFLRLTTIGIIATISIQALINLVVVTGLGPTKGIALPLMSSGGTGWIMTAFALGLVVSIDRTQAFSMGLLGSMDSAEDERIAIRAWRDSEIEAKPNGADRAGLLGASFAPAMIEETRAYDAHPVDDDEMEELLADPVAVYTPKHSLLDRFRPNPKHAEKVHEETKADERADLFI
jgi:cell division protein FtsW